MSPGLPLLLAVSVAGAQPSLSFDVDESTDPSTLPALHQGLFDAWAAHERAVGRGPPPPGVGPWYLGFAEVEEPTLAPLRFFRVGGTQPGGHSSFSQLWGVLDGERVLFRTSYATACPPGREPASGECLDLAPRFATALLAYPGDALVDEAGRGLTQLVLGFLLGEASVVLLSDDEVRGLLSDASSPAPPTPPGGPPPAPPHPAGEVLRGHLRSESPTIRRVMAFELTVTAGGLDLETRNVMHWTTIPY